MPGKESVCIVCLPDARVKESKERVVGALYSLECEFPDKKEMNLSPAEHRRNSQVFDLTIAVGMVKDVNHFQDKIPDDAAFLGACHTMEPLNRWKGLPVIFAAKKKRLYLPIIPDLPLTGWALISILSID
ncbi:hypothetical protein GMB86_09360 [Terrilactibacillus sp. BCM23-1]|uniref:Uncharacterized protein n=2 Tax=Terrilactibacillus tamarindi TaxID=2599694 RepID=A0A6N8CRA2_9BACI|nr:hypothetical protein [Terrilactibacillus tamarindi]